MKPFRQGDVLLIPGWDSFGLEDLTPRPDLVLAEGEATGHKHQISQGQAELYAAQLPSEDAEGEGVLYLRVLSETALLTHEEHLPITLPKGNWTVRRQREYRPEGWRYILD